MLPARFICIIDFIFSHHFRLKIALQKHVIVEGDEPRVVIKREVPVVHTTHILTKRPEIKNERATSLFDEVVSYWDLGHLQKYAH